MIDCISIDTLPTFLAPDKTIARNSSVILTLDNDTKVKNSEHKYPLKVNLYRNITILLL